MALLLDQIDVELARLEKINPGENGEAPHNWAPSVRPPSKDRLGGTPGNRNSQYFASLPPVMSAAALDLSSILVVLMVAVVVAAVVGWSVAATVLHRDRAPTTAAGDAGPGPDVAAQVAAQVAAGQADLAAKREVIATQL